MRKAHAGTGTAEVREIQKPDEQWRQELTPLQYSVLRQAHTERPFTGEYVHNHADGFYRCAGCGSKLFSSDAKFDSGTGWPSFDEPAVAEAVELRPDNSLFMRRTEVVCRHCGGHLGHVFSPRRRTRSRATARPGSPARPAADAAGRPAQGWSTTVATAAQP